MSAKLNFNCNIKLLATKIITIIVLSALAWAPQAQAGVRCESLFTHPAEAILSLKNPHLQVKTTKLVGPEKTEDQYHLSVSLGDISKEEFNELKKSFKVSPTENYDPNHSYTLADFLPHFVQQVLGKRILEKPQPVPREILSAFQSVGKNLSSDTMSVNSNCHSLTWQFINFLQGHGRQQAYLFGVDGGELAVALDHFKTVSAPEVKTGDVLLIQGTGGLGNKDGIQHSAIMLSDSLVLEKTDWGEKYYYRIAYLKDVMAKYERVTDNIEFKFYRIDGQYELPRYEDTKSFGTQVKIFAGLEGDYDFSYFNSVYEGIPKAVSSKYLLLSSYESDQFYFYVYPVMNTSQAAGLLSN